MTNSAKTIYYFAFYLFATGATLLAAPNLLLETFGLPPTEEVWIRLVGMLVLFLGFYYHAIAKRNLHELIKLSVLLRLSVLAFFGAFVAMGWVEPPLLLFAGIDVAGAAWSYLALKKEGHYK